MATREEIQAILAEQASPKPEDSPGGVTGVLKSVSEFIDPVTVPSRLYEAATGASVKEKAAEKGVGYDEPLSMEDMYQAGIPADASGQLHRMSQALDEHFGQPVELKYDKDLNSVLYNHPDKGWQFINKPGASAGDIGFLASNVPETVGGIAGSVLPIVLSKGKKLPKNFMQRFGSWFKAATGGTIGGAAGGAVRGAQEAATERLEPGQTPPSMEQKALEHAGRAAVETATGEVAGPIVGAMAKGLVKTAAGKYISPDAIERGLRLGDEVPESVTKMQERLGPETPVQLTPGQVLNDPLLKSVEKEALQTPQGRQVAEGQARAAGAFLKSAGEPHRTLDEAPTPTATGQAVQEAAKREQRPQLEEMAHGMQASEQAVESAADNVFHMAGESPKAAGGIISDIANRHVKEFRDWAAKEYEGLGGATEGLTGRPANLFAEAQTQRGIIDQDIAPTLSSENKRLVDEINGFLSSDKGDVGFTQLQRLISQLKQVERTKGRNAINGMDYKAIGDLKAAALRDRDEMLRNSGNSELIDKFSSLEREYATRRAGINDSIIGDIAKGDKIHATQAFNKVFAPGDRGAQMASEFSEALANPRNYADAQAFKGAIYRKYSDEVKTAKDHDRFMKRYGPALSGYLSEAEQGTFQKYGGAMRLHDELMAEQKQLAADLEKSFAGKLQKTDPEDIADMLWRKEGNIEAATTMLKGKHPEAWQAVQSHFLDKVENDITTWNKALETKTVDFNKLNKYLDDKGTQRKLRRMFGEEYVSDLNTLKDFTMRMERSKGAVLGEDAPKGNAAVGLLKAVFFGPLSHGGYVLRKLGSANAQVAHENLMKIMLDPAALNKLAKEVQVTKPEQAARHILGQVGVEGYMAETPEQAPELQTPGAIDSLSQRLSSKQRARDKLRKILGEKP